MFLNHSNVSISIRKKESCKHMQHVHIQTCRRNEDDEFKCRQQIEYVHQTMLMLLEHSFQVNSSIKKTF